jgi:hypothetical protein
MIFARELLAVDLQRQMIEKSQGHLGSQGTPVDAILANAYGAADIALKVREVQLTQQFDKPAVVQ